ncbi:Acetyl-coenzyme A synthetase [Sedimentisphaera cyanobacteriorum]|uniref:Acetyl-coenzyme A synthetase n=1 Tax=Sedimentisphaera cyanobacteriorum TaxID=1940790 RepID=A0A1Q2HN41_9BACT|nr:AMP-binding protein [Sedimentisphaera cyanobacteriorum]AQQ08862.1 Acetyl-coenzyme A synthetase [Sedimentisphaera cyanobacteriorum]
MNLLNKFLKQTSFKSYEDFRKNYKVIIPDDFNFAYDVVDYYADHSPEKRALVWVDDNDNEKIISFAEMSEYSKRAASYFHSRGIGKADCVLLTLKGRFEFWYCLLGLHRIGAIAVPATHMLKKKDFEYRFDKAQIKMVVSDNDPELINQIDAAHESFKDLVKIKSCLKEAPNQQWENFTEAIEQSSRDFERPEGGMKACGEDAMLVYFSSGTTAYPKMVEHNFNYPLGHIITAKYWQNVIDDGLHYTVADTGWAKCVWGKIYGQWIAGSAVFTHDYKKFNAAKMLKKASEYKVNTFCAPPTIYRFIIKEDMEKYDFSNIKYCVVAGEPLNPEIYNKFLSYTGIKLMEGYGQTETTPLVFTFPETQPKPGSMGKPNPDYDLKLINSEGEECDPGEEGEIVIDTAVHIPAGLFTQYRSEPERTDQSWHNNCYHTGDIAWKDEDGYFWFVGRADDVIKSSGYRIGPFEVESALLEHPAVLECAVTGVPDEIRGTAVKATVVLTKDYKASDELVRELQKHVKDVTAPYKYPRVVKFAESLPKTISGKIRRVQLRKN